MIRIVLPDESSSDATFYLAVEEWVAKNLPEGKYFFAWQVAPSVICGRHQHIPSEVNLDFARENGIMVVRRKSGGGSVYADSSNIMFSYITGSNAVQVSFDDYTSMICGILSSLGLRADPTGRNDIAIDGRKVAGNAFLKLPGRSIVHGTMLYDADVEIMSKVLTPSRAKKESKGVVSVQSRVTTLKNEGIELDIPSFIAYAMDYLCREGKYEVSAADLAEIEDIRQSYQTLLPCTEEKAKEEIYIEGVGQIAVRLDTDEQGLISSAVLSGDFFPLIDAQKALNDALVGRRLCRQEIREALKELSTEKIIAGLTPEIAEKLLMPNN